MKCALHFSLAFLSFWFVNTAMKMRRANTRGDDAGIFCAGVRSVSWATCTRVICAHDEDDKTPARLRSLHSICPFLYDFVYLKIIFLFSVFIVQRTHTQHTYVSTDLSRCCWFSSPFSHSFSVNTQIHCVVRRGRWILPSQFRIRIQIHRAHGLY